MMASEYLNASEWLADLFKPIEAKVDKLTKERDEAQAELAEAKVTVAAQADMLKTERKQLTDMVLAKEAENAKLRAELESYKGVRYTNKRLAEELAKLREENKRLREEYEPPHGNPIGESLRREVVRIRDENDVLKRQNQNQSSQIDLLLKSSNKATDKMLEAAESFNRASEVITKLRKQHAEVEALAGAMARALIAYQLTVDEPAPYHHRMLVKRARAILPATEFDPFVRRDAKAEGE